MNYFADYIQPGLLIGLALSLLSSVVSRAIKEWKAPYDGQKPDMVRLQITADRSIWVDKRLIAEIRDTRDGVMVSFLGGPQSRVDLIGTTADEVAFDIGWNDEVPMKRRECVNAANEQVQA